MSKYLKRKINTIFLMLGNSCNLNCRYCMQHDLVEHGLSAKVNPDIYEFIKEAASEFGEQKGLNIQFYGGEPLIYFETIKDVVENLNGTNVTFSIITNGKAITEEMVDFFNEHDMPVTISWDGKTVLETRGYDVFAKENSQRELLFKINRLGVSAVTSAYAYPSDIVESFQELTDAYREIHGYELYFNIDEIFNTGGVPRDLFDIDYDRVENEMFELSKEFAAIKFNDVQLPIDKYAGFVIIDRMFGFLVDFYIKNKGKERRVYCGCGNGYNILNLDLDGNLYSCHNTSEVIGTIYDNYFKYLNNVIKMDSVISRRVMCTDCPAIAFCSGGCKLVPDIELEGFCKLKKSMFLPVLSLVQQLGNIVKKGDGNA